SSSCRRSKWHPGSTAVPAVFTGKMPVPQEKLMIKLLICLTCGMVMAVVMLQLRQQELELRHQAADLQLKIQNHQAKLWQQQLEIAVYTAPNAVTKIVQDQNLKLVPEAALPLQAGDWVGTTSQQNQPVTRR